MSAGAVLLFDWSDGGHHRYLMREMAIALIPHRDVIVAASDPVLAGLSDLPAEQYSLGAPRPRLDVGRATQEVADLARRDIAMLREACEATRPERAVHLYGDPILRWLISEPELPVPTAIGILFSWSHYPSLGQRLPVRTRLRSRWADYKLARWRRRSDAVGVFVLDPHAARRLAELPGAPVHWLPDPPVRGVPEELPLPVRADCVFFGYLEHRKGLDLLAQALSLEQTDLSLLIAGSLPPPYRDELERCVAKMREAGVEVTLDVSEFLPYERAMAALASGACAVLPYRWHPGSSRVLVEAATVGVPVVGPEAGLVGHFIDHYGLGEAVDPTDALALREAVMRLGRDPSARERYAPALTTFVEEIARGFEEAVVAVTLEEADDPRPTASVHA